jgi:predicted Zn-dependent protease
MIGRQVLWWVVAIPGLAALGSCVTNPATGQKELILVSEQQEIDMGREAAAAVPRETGIYGDSTAHAYVSHIGLQLASGSERPTLPWTFNIADDPAVNAFALPGGFIFVTRGLLTDLNSEAELASVVGHEIGHVTARHSAQQITRAELATAGLVLGSAVSTTFANMAGAAQIGLQLLFLQYSRGDESQADELGFRYALRQNYDVRAMRDVFITLDGVSRAAGGARVPEWQSTHPAPENRIKAVDARIAATQTDWSTKRLGRDTYLKVIDGMVYGQNPRQGYFEGSTFYHPELKFQLTFPSGWQTNNQAGSVAALSPQQDALVQISFAGASPEESARGFFNGQGITSGPVVREQIGGLPAVSGDFQAQTDQGVLAGRAAFVACQGHTYALIGYTGSDRFSSYAPAFRAALGSFKPLTDPKALAVQPNRLKLQQAPRAMSLAAFNQAYPSIVNLKELALVNRLDTNATLAQGQWMKRVVSAR